MTDRLLATISLLLGGLFVALGLVGAPQSPVVAVEPVLSVALLGAGGAIAVGASAVRHNRLAPLHGHTIAAIGGVIGAGIGAVILGVGPGAAVALGVGAGIAGVLALLTGLAGLSGLPLERLAEVIRVVSVAGLLMMLALLLGGVLLAIPSAVVGDRSLALETAVEQLALGIAFVAATLGFVILTDRGLGYFDIAHPARRDVGWAVGGLAVVIVTALAIGALYTAFGIEGAEHAIASRARQEGVLVLLVGLPLTLFVTAVGEEVLYRNGIQKYLTEHLEAGTAIAVTSVLFAAAHLPALATGSPGPAIASLALIFVLSVIIGVCYERTRNLLVPVVIHGGYNVAVFLTWYVQLAS